MNEGPGSKRRAACWPSFAVLALLASCYSLGGYRVDQRVVAGDRSALLAIWCCPPFETPANGDEWALQAIGGLLLWPVDAIVSTAEAVRAPFDEKFEVRGGPFGAVAGICLPWVTLMSYFITPSVVLHPPEELELSSAEFEQLLARVRAGEGVEACSELGRFGSLGEGIYAVEVIEETQAEPTGR